VLHSDIMLYRRINRFLEAIRLYRIPLIGKEMVVFIHIHGGTGVGSLSRVHAAGPCREHFSTQSRLASQKINSVKSAVEKRERVKEYCGYFCDKSHPTKWDLHTLNGFLSCIVCIIFQMSHAVLICGFPAVNRTAHCMYHMDSAVS